MAVPSNSSPGQTQQKAQKKAVDTHNAAMQIVQAELVAREKKTARLRQLRLEHAASDVADAPQPPAAKAQKGGKSARKSA
ncbi:MAG: hypothetical protein KL863_09335 [Rhizobium sp.]|nr:hypothetical protein [Rhizobium sp.]